MKEEPSPTARASRLGDGAAARSLAGLWILIAAGVIAPGLAGPPEERLWLQLAPWVLAGGAWIAALRRAAVVPARWVVLGAIALRLLALAGDPRLSDDLYRYVWEGALVAEGENPYAAAPDAPERGAERERWAAVHAGINHRDVPAAYPPLSQALHGLVVGAVGPLPPERAMGALRCAYAAADLLVLLPLLALLRRRGLPPGIALAWGWSPLAAVEFAGSGHLDSLAILLLVAAVERADRARRVGTAWSPAAVVLAALGGAAKLLPFAFVPLAGRGRPLRALLLAGALAVCAWAPFAWGAGAGALAGLGQYAARWEANSLAFRWVEAALVALLAGDASPGPGAVARALVGLAFAGVVLREWRRGDDPAAGAGRIAGAFVVLSPTLHPWYLTWVLPFLALRPALSWSVLLALAPVAYAPVAGWRARGEWHEPVWTWALLALPFAALWLREALGARGARGARGEAAR